MRDPAPPLRAALPRALLVERRLSALAGLAAVAASAWLLHGLLGPGPALRWTAGAAAAVAYLLWELHRRLHRNVRRGETAILPTLGAGTALTLLRGLFCALLAGFLLIPQPEGALAWAPLLLYTAAAVADFFDGYAARVHNHATRLGAALDVAFDAFGALIAVGVLVRHGKLPAAFLTVGLVYYAFHAHAKLRNRLGRPFPPLRPNPYRRMYAGFLFGYFAVALAPVFQPSWVEAGGYLFVAPVLAGFAIDWFACAGAIPLQSRRWLRFEETAERLLYRTAPVALRAAVLAAGAVWLAAGLGAERGWARLFAAQGWPEPTLLAAALAIAALAALGMTTAGWLGRLAALLLIALACADVLLRASPTPEAYALLLPSIGILLLGAGRGALWGPEDRLLLTQAGSPRTSAGPERAAA